MKDFQQTFYLVPRFDTTAFLLYVITARKIRNVDENWTKAFCRFAGHKDDDNGRSSGSHSLSSLSKKQRKARTAFTDHQLQTLEKSFERQKYLSVQDRMELAAKLNLSDTQVKTWYQNRR